MRIIKFLIIILLLSSAYGKIEFSGNAVFRPRYDLKEYGDFPKDDTLKSTADIYYWYRARIIMNASIGDGWMFNTKLSALGPATFTKMGAGDRLNPVFPESSGRPSVYFMELYWGFHHDRTGLWGGIIPVNGINNPALDIHYYPEKMVDIPWVLFNNNATTGFAGYFHLGAQKVNWVWSIDNEVVNTEEPTLGENISRNERMTVMGNLPVNLKGMKITGIFLKTLASADEAAPFTTGLRVQPDMMGNLSLSGGFYMTRQDHGDAPGGSYRGWLVRSKVRKPVGPGTFTAWVDIAELNRDSAPAHRFFYFWGHYKILLYSSDSGAVSVKPTLRYLVETADGETDFSRLKAEVTMEIKFR